MIVKILFVLFHGMVKVEKVTDYLFEVPKQGGMLVPGRIYASESLFETQRNDEAVMQVVNVAHLPGIVKYSLAMPDFHWGYGFPIGGVAAFDLDEGIISPGGVGYDINCGVRIMGTSLVLEEVKPRIKDIVRNVFRAIPAGVGSQDAITKLSFENLKQVTEKGAKWAIDDGYGNKEDLDHIEEHGCLDDADINCVSKQAIDRGRPQLGTLGSGNHFLEIQYVQEIYIPEMAKKLGLFNNQIVVSIHSGSRGFGYQVCDDYIDVMLKASEKYGIKLMDKQLCCAPIRSDEAKRYFAAMKAAANYAWANRQVMRGIVQRVMAKTLGIGEDQLDMRLIYDVCHNIAKVEEFEIDGKKQRLAIHRKGATRAYGPNHPLVPQVYKETGQPVFIPGDMGRCSYLLLGTQKAVDETFGSSCHGAGRVQSRKAMIKKTQGRNLYKELDEKYGVFVMAHGHASVAEEMPEAYKDATEVVDTIERAGISRKLAKLKPIGCIKG